MAQPDRKPQWRRLTPEARRETILEVASRQFSNRPYEDVSTIEIAAEAGVNRGLIHHYIGTKRELYLEVLRRHLHIPSLPQLVALEGPQDFERAIADGIDAWLDDVERVPEPWRAFQRASVGPGRDPEVEKLLHDAREVAIDEAMQVRFAEAEPPPAVRGLVSSLAALVTQAAIIEWLELGRLTREQARTLILRMTLALWSHVEEVLGEQPKPGAQRQPQPERASPPA